MKSFLSLFLLVFSIFANLLHILQYICWCCFTTKSKSSIKKLHLQCKTFNINQFWNLKWQVVKNCHVKREWSNNLSLLSWIHKTILNSNLEQTLNFVIFIVNLVEQLKRIYFFSGRTPGQGPEDHPYGVGLVGGRYLPHTSSSSGGLVRRRSTESRESLASHASQSGQVSTLRHSHSHKTLSRRGSRHRSREDNRGSSSRPRSPPLPLNPATPLYSKKDLGLSEPGKTPTQDASDRCRLRVIHKNWIRNNDYKCVSARITFVTNYWDLPRRRGSTSQARPNSHLTVTSPILRIRC